MKRWLIRVAVLVALAGCSVPQGGLMKPVFEGYSQGQAEPVMEVAVVDAAPMQRPRARPAWIEACGAGDDGIGGTGCPVD